MCLNIVERMANSVDPDQMSQSAVSDMGSHYLLRSLCSNTPGKYSNEIMEHVSLRNKNKY